MEELVVLVTESDEVVGTMEKMEAHKKALLHRAVSVFVCNSQGEWLVQQRALEKYHSSGLWTNTCCTHPYPNESYTDAAARRLQQEMGLTCRIQKLFEFVYKETLDNELTEHELDCVFFGITDDVPVPNSAEVMNYVYKPFEQIQKELEESPELYTVWFRKIAKKVSQNIAVL